MSCFGGVGMRSLGSKIFKLGQGVITCKRLSPGDVYWLSVHILGRINMLTTKSTQKPRVSTCMVSGCHLDNQNTQT